MFGLAVAKKPYLIITLRLALKMLHICSHLAICLEANSNSKKPGVRGRRPARLV